MTQSASPTSQTDTLVSVRLDGLIDILQGLCLEDRSAIAVALLADSGQNISEEAVASDSAGSSSHGTPTPAPHAATVDSAVDPAVDPAIGHPPSPPLVPAEVHAPSTLIIDNYDVTSDDEDAANAVSALAADSNLKFYHGKYFNVPIVEKAPFYYITRGHYISVFSGWDATGPKILGVSHAIFHKVDTVDIGVGIVRGAIDRGEAMQVL
ncbi:hypothetical protein K503DRAFT_804816 [Rhizopogon vinicolor AM-OR11-026]|uniref:Uncharacterized protein n=1 Tax=Rhizopogon vinicolor AM-OR11-026 TaxID=1314800 RepID=A0A1B7MJZ6_9AGAM|nr:hypothetical protein K503DRAFT_804816 [Rhizopogon vinicolor AM-OR11-026]